MEHLLQLLLFPKRIRFRWRNRKRLTVTESLKATLKARCEEAARAEVPAYQGVYNVGLFAVLVEQDISAYSEAIFFARSEWHRQFYARGLAVLLYEANEDFPQLLGKQYRSWLQDLELGSEWINSLNQVGRKLSAFNKSHGPFLKELRNYVSAHRDHDALSQIDIMAKFKAIDIYRLGAEFSLPLNDLVAFYTHLLRYLHNPAVMLRHVAKSLSET